MESTLISIIGTLIVICLGWLLILVRATRQDVEKLEIHFFEALDKAKTQILEKVCKNDCIRLMAEVKDDLKEAVRDIRKLEKGEK